VLFSKRIKSTVLFSFESISLLMNVNGSVRLCLDVLEVATTTPRDNTPGMRSRVEHEVVIRAVSV